eukprot:s1149_g5.t1
MAKQTSLICLYLLMLLTSLTSVLNTRTFSSLDCHAITRIEMPLPPSKNQTGAKSAGSTRQRGNGGKSLCSAGDQRSDTC